MHYAHIYIILVVFGPILQFYIVMLLMVPNQDTFNQANRGIYNDLFILEIYFWLFTSAILFTINNVQVFG